MRRNRAFRGVDLLLVAVILIQAVVLTGRLVKPAPVPEPAAILGDEIVKHYLGNVAEAASAPQSVVVFNDYRCPACRALDARLDTLVREGLVRVYYRHYPLRNHADARTAAIAAECAALQGRFETYHKLLFASQQLPAPLNWVRLAVEASVADSAEFARCVERQETAARVGTDIADGESLRLASTPAIIIGRRLFVGALTMGSLRSALDGDDAVYEASK